jgi:hypothetical protein
MIGHEIVFTKVPRKKYVRNMMHMKKITVFRGLLSCDEFLSEDLIHV